MEEQITDMSQVDARMIIDYAYLGDKVTLDTTYSTKNAYQPIAIFVGFNHFRGVVIFGPTFLYDETIKSFKWLFETLLEAHKKKNLRLFSHIKTMPWLKLYLKLCLKLIMHYALAF